MATKRYVRPSKGGWDIIEEGHRRSAMRTPTKKEAVARAREIVRNAGGGEIRVMNSHGKITDANTVAASKARSGSNQRVRTAKRSVR